VLDYLQSKTIVGIQDCYPFWRDQNHAPWAGKPVWARMNAVGNVSSNGSDNSGSHHHNHHHILLDDNIHNDPNDGAGGIRIPIVDTSGNDDDTPSTLKSTSYESLYGTEALDMHGKHFLIHVPTIPI